MAGSKLNVFLCHSSADKPIVRELYRQLSEEGWIDVWLDEESLLPGQNWDLEIEKAIESTDVILVCLSNNSITKDGYIQHELRTVLVRADYKPEETIFIIPVRLENCTPPRHLKQWQYADYFEKDRDRSYQRLLAGLRTRAISLGISTVPETQPSVLVKELSGGVPNPPHDPDFASQSVPHISSTTQKDVFIRYSQKDKLWVHNLISQLEKVGIKVHYDERDFQPGSPLIKEVERAARQCLKTIVVLTPNYLGSDWTKFENILAQTQKPADSERRLIPIMLKDCAPPPRLSSLVWVDFRDPLSESESLKKLIKAIKPDIDFPVNNNVMQNIRKTKEEYNHNVEIAIVLNGDLKGFKKKEQLALIRSLSVLLDVSQNDIKLMAIEPDIKLWLEMPRFGADKLSALAKVQDQRLNNLGIIKVISSSVGSIIRERFVGRQRALEEFYQRFTYTHMKNAVYYCGEGGSGKTWILKKLLLDNEKDNILVMTDIIDFFNTENQSIYGLQSSIRIRLEKPGEPHIFEPYDNIVQQITESRLDPNSSGIALLASLETKANKVFVECCQKSIRGRKVILLMDTFEKVQQLDVGQWVLKSFLPEVLGAIIVIAGRPFPPSNPIPSKMPNNVVTFILNGMEVQEIQTYLDQSWPQISKNDRLPKLLSKVTKGNPLLLDIVIDLLAEEIAKGGGILNEIRDINTLKHKLAQKFTDPNNVVNQVVWAMTYLKRRFDLPMLSFLLDHEIFAIEKGEIGNVLEQLGSFRFIKEYPELQTHLLHGEVQELIENYVLNENDPRWDFRNLLYNLIVGDYYTKLIESARLRGNNELFNQLRSEQFGYMFERELAQGKVEDAYALYIQNRNSVDKDLDYSYEELIWGEVRAHFISMNKYGYELVVERGLWLRRQGLFSKAVDHYNEALSIYSEHQDKKIELYKSLGFSLLRTGDLNASITILEDGLALLNPAYDTQDIADFENLLGQAKSGNYGVALVHYHRAHRAFTKEKNYLGEAGVNISRGVIYSSQGLYEDAKREEERAISLLNAMDNEPAVSRLKMFAQLHMGTPFRYSGDYDQAEKWYLESMKTAQLRDDREGLCLALSNLGITYCLKGKKSRINGNLAHAVQSQLNAWKNLMQVLEIARKSHWQNPLAGGLSRTAKIYEELHRILQIVNINNKNETENQLREFQTLTKSFQPSSEVEYEYDLLIPRKFSEFNNLEKSARLFELSYLAADSIEDFHRALDSLMEFSRLMLELKQYELVPIIVRKIERIKGYDFQERLFEAVAEITMADLSYDRKDYTVALNKYASSFEMMAKQTGYAAYVLTDRIESLSKRINSLPRTIRLQWCDVLEDRWLKGYVSMARPDMLRMLEDIRFKTINTQGDDKPLV